VKLEIGDWLGEVLDALAFVSGESSESCGGWVLPEEVSDELARRGQARLSEDDQRALQDSSYLDTTRPLGNDGQRQVYWGLGDFGLEALVAWQRGQREQAAAMTKPGVLSRPSALAERFVPAPA